MKETKKPYNVYLIKNDDGTEELKIIQGVFDGEYKLYLGLYVLTDDEVRFPLLNFETGQIYLNKELKKRDDREKAIKNLEDYIKNNPQDTTNNFSINSEPFLFYRDDEENLYGFDFQLHDQINILSQIILEINPIKIHGIKNFGEKKYLEFCLEEAKKIYSLLYNNLDHNKRDLNGNY